MIPKDKIIKVTAIIQIGNSDNKLTQAQWSKYVLNMRRMIQEHNYETHFSGSSETWQPWQNAAWVINVEQERLSKLKRDLVRICKQHNQDSIALTIGETEFLEGTNKGI